MFRNILTLSALLSLSISYAQDHNEHHITLMPESGDSLCLKDCLAKAHWEAHTRTYFMSTINEGALKDDYALASGAGIGLLTKPLYGFQVGVSGFFMYNLASSKIHEPDATTGQANRYEVGLFDIEDHTNKRDLDRLEELYIKYSRSKSALTVGKINLNTPFFNPQDSRMRPTVEEGIWLSVKESQKIGFNGGWIRDVSPRSTVSWFRLSNSMGIYSLGVNTDGTRSDYKDNIVGCSGMAIANIYINPTKHLNINLWNSFLENVMNTAIMEVNLEQEKEGMTFHEGLILLHQDALNHGGNADPAKSYLNSGDRSNVISVQIGWRKRRINTNVNYTHITGDGRYLMPREWGREMFYTYLNRERNEGLGNVHALMTKTTFTSKNNKFSTALGYGYYALPDVKDYRLNKYGLPSYHQLNLYASYAFSKFLRGMELKFLAAYKMDQGKTYGDDRYVYNKVNMINFNLVLDFKL